MLIQQVLMNLLENAVLNAEGMTTLTLRVFTLGSRAVFMKDDGCGIPKERLRTLFGTGGPTPTPRADSGKHGMGIGLSACAAIIKAHGARSSREPPRRGHDHPFLAGDGENRTGGRRG